MGDNLYYVFGEVYSDCGNPVLDLIGKVYTKERAEEIKEIFSESYDNIEIHNNMEEIQKLMFQRM